MTVRTRSSRRAISGRSGAPGKATANEIVEQPPELTLEVDISMVTGDVRHLTRRCDPCPDPPPGQIERDREPDDQQPEGGPAEHGPGVLLCDEQGVLAEAPDADDNVGGTSGLTLAGGKRERKEVIS